MPTWRGVRNGPSLQLRVWATERGRAGFTLDATGEAGIIDPLAQDDSSATYRLGAHRDWRLHLTVTDSSAAGAKIKVWHEVRQPADGDILACVEVPIEPPVNGDGPFEPVQLGEVELGQGAEFGFRVRTRSDP